MAAYSPKNRLPEQKSANTMPHVSSLKDSAVPKRVQNSLASLHDELGNRAVGESLQYASSSLTSDQVETSESIAGAAPALRDMYSSGRPIEPATRKFMESRFGEDFSQVRIHTNNQASSDARKQNALAYTVGQDIVFDSGQYRPNEMTGRAMLAHELAHTVQQRQAQHTDVTTDISALEQRADNAAVAVLQGQQVNVGQPTATPAVQFLKVTSGGFGRALEEFTEQWQIPDQAIHLLRGSATFMQIARTLDRNFAWRTDSYRHEPLNYDANGRITNGPRSIRGRRELMVTIDHSGASFMPFESPDHPLSADVISIQNLDIAGFIQDIAHEAVHARNFVTGTGGAPATLAASIADSIQEEIDVRNTEAVILSEIPSRTVRRDFHQVGSTDPVQVERDFAPGIGLTYLENAFFSWRLQEAQAVEGLTDEEAQEIREQISPSTPPFIFGKRPNPQSGLFELSSYAEVWFNRLTAIQEWREFHSRNSPSDPGYQTRIEAMRQAHARRFFEGRVQYRQRP